MIRRSLAGGLGWIIVSLAFLVGTSTAGPLQTSGQTPELAGLTTLRGETGRTSVILPRDVRLSGGPGLGLEVGGGGRVTAFVLRKTQPANASRPAPIIYGWSVSGCNKPGCTPSGPRIIEAISENLHRGKVLPSGRYDLYFVADAKDAWVKLKLPGLPGTRAIRSTSPIKTELVTPPSQTAIPDRSGWFSQTDEGWGPGLTLVHLKVRTTGQAALGRLGVCMFDEAQDDSSSAPYLSGCNSADDRAEAPISGSRGWLDLVRFGEAPASVGGWYTAADEMKRSRALTLRIEM